MRMIIIAAFAAVTLAGCAGGGNTASSGPVSIDGLAKKAGCSNFQIDKEGQMYTRQIGMCQVGGQDVYLMTFQDNGKRDEWLKVAPAGGGMFAMGDRFALQSFDEAALKKAATGTDAAAL